MCDPFYSICGDFLAQERFLVRGFSSSVHRHCHYKPHWSCIHAEMSKPPLPCRAVSAPAPAATSNGPALLLVVQGRRSRKLCSAWEALIKPAQKGLLSLLAASF